MANESEFSVLAETVSTIAGRMSAMDAALRALIVCARSNPAFHAALEVEFEHEYARHLATSMNGTFLREFEDQLGLLRAVLQSPQDG